MSRKNLILVKISMLRINQLDFFIILNINVYKQRIYSWIDIKNNPLILNNIGRKL